MAIGAPASTTTTVWGLAAAALEISSFCAEGRLRLRRSVASDSGVVEDDRDGGLRGLGSGYRLGYPRRNERWCAQRSWSDAPLI
jgi:hypothetical protein